MDGQNLNQINTMRIGRQNADMMSKEMRMIRIKEQPQTTTKLEGMKYKEKVKKCNTVTSSTEMAATVTDAHLSMTYPHHAKTLCEDDVNGNSACSPIRRNNTDTRKTQQQTMMSRIFTNGEKDTLESGTKLGEKTNPQRM